jgi:DNA-binding NtrC family response regulator
MPRIKGTKLAAEMREVRPALPVILVTGFGGALQSSVFQGVGLYGPLQKPFTSESLLALVADVIERNG